MRIIKDGIVTYNGTLESNKLEALSIVSEWFLSKMKYNVLQTSVGFPIDNRRYGDKNDLENMRSLRDLGVTTIRGSDGIMHTVTTTELNTIIQEMQVDGLSGYQTKWIIEDAINSKTTIEDIWVEIDTFIENNPILT